MLLLDLPLPARAAPWQLRQRRTCLLPCRWVDSITVLRTLSAQLAQLGATPLYYQTLGPRKSKGDIPFLLAGVKLTCRTLSRLLLRPPSRGRRRPSPGERRWRGLQPPRQQQ